MSMEVQEAHGRHSVPTPTLSSDCEDAKEPADGAEKVTAPYPPCLMNEAIYSVLSTADDGFVVIHTLGSIVSKSIGSRAYKSGLRGRKLADYLSSQDWLVLNRELERVSLLASDKPSGTVPTYACTASEAKEESGYWPVGKKKKPRAKKQEIEDNINRIGDIVIACPHCLDDIVVAKKSINCGVFRHGVLKSNGRPIKPHGTQAYCDELVRSEKIYGCGQPFKIVTNKTASPWEYTVEICGWI